ncbi:hypothetical protein TREES_T100014540 [Tupaia chinensis]|uniref:Uncharacterized protein n=1 Tax=Tupaia chinensis TaxID=246437 RepID=L9LCP2_TUPCH|nr:hypothetical protein TREES_T100014540 [Tupaia chinensis]
MNTVCTTTAAHQDREYMGASGVSSRQSCLPGPWEWLHTAHPPGLHQPGLVLPVSEQLPVCSRTADNSTTDVQGMDSPYKRISPEQVRSNREYGIQKHQILLASVHLSLFKV